MIIITKVQWALYSSNISALLELLFFWIQVKKGADEHEGQLCDARLEWLKEQLIAAEDKPVFIFMHHPPSEIGVSYVDEISLIDSEKFVLVLKYAKNLRHVFLATSIE